MTPGEMILGWCFECQAERRWASSLPEHWRLGSDHEVCAGPVWPGVRVHDQAELEAEIGSLLVIRSPIQSPGRWVEWIPGRGRLDLQDYLLLSDMPTNETAGVDWLRIAAAEDSNHPVPDISDIRYVVEQCQEAKIPVWIESLLCTSGGGWMFPRVADPAEWPEDLRGCRELPELGP